MKIFINDHEVNCGENQSLASILTENNIPVVNTAIAIDNCVIPKVQWTTTFVKDGCRIIIIKAVQGG